MNFSDHTFLSCYRCAWVLRIRLRHRVCCPAKGGGLHRPPSCPASVESHGTATGHVGSDSCPLLLFAPLPTPDVDNKKLQAPEKQQKPCDRKMH